jgi:hypothetical protein
MATGGRRNGGVVGNINGKKVGSDAFGCERGGDGFARGLIARSHQDRYAGTPDMPCDSSRYLGWLR